MYAKEVVQNQVRNRKLVLNVGVAGKLGSPEELRLVCSLRLVPALVVMEME